MNVPSGYSALDLVGFTDKGDYLPSATYVKNDLVHYNDKIWKCLIDDTTGIVPTTGLNWDIWIDQSNSLNGLADVEITNPTDGQELSYDATTQKWKNTSKIQSLTNEVKDMNNVYGSKNLLILTSYSKGETVSLNGGTIKCNEDGSYTINGTFTSDAALKIDWLVSADRREISNLRDKILIASCNGYNTSDIQFYTGCFKTDGTASQVGRGAYGETPRQYTMPSDAYTFRNWISIAAKTYSNVTIYPMVCLASVYELSPDWQSPSETNQQLTQDTTGLLDNLEVNGAVNMLPNNAISQVINGITFTVNDDGSVTANGTATAEVTWLISTTLGKGNYHLSGAPKTGSFSTYWTYYQKDGVTQDNDFGDGLTFTLDNEAVIRYVIKIKSGYAASNLTFKPMITVSSYNGDYVPYAKSNKELTEELEIDSASVTENGITANFKKWGKVCTVSFTGAFNAAFAYDTVFLNIPSGFAPGVNCQMLSTNKPSSVSDRIVLNIGYNGTINVAGQNVASGDQLRGSFTYVTA